MEAGEDFSHTENGVHRIPFGVGERRNGVEATVHEVVPVEQEDSAHLDWKCGRFGRPRRLFDEIFGEIRLEVGLHVLPELTGKVSGNRFPVLEFAHIGEVNFVEAFDGALLADKGRDGEKYGAEDGCGRVSVVFWSMDGADFDHRSLEDFGNSGLGVMASLMKGTYREYADIDERVEGSYEGFVERAFFFEFADFFEKILEFVLPIGAHAFRAFEYGVHFFDFGDDAEDGVVGEKHDFTEKW